MQMNSIRIFGPLVAVIVACLCPTLVSVQTVVQDNWLGGTGTWDDPSMWSAGVSPNGCWGYPYGISVTVNAAE